MSNLQIFKNKQFGELRTVSVDGKPYVVGVDVARMLEYAKPSQAVIDHCKGIRKLGIPSAGGIQETNVISEGDIYRLIVKAADQSKNSAIKEKAEKIEHWIFDEVLPDIRKYGAYMTPEKIEEVLLNPDTIIRLASDLKAEREARQVLESKVEQNKPKVIFADAVSASYTSILVGDLAKLIRQNGYDIGQNRLFNYLRDKGYLIKSGSSRNMPTQRAMDLGLFKVKETVINNPDGSTRVTRTTKVTGKGQIYFLHHFLDRKYENQTNGTEG